MGVIPSLIYCHNYAKLVFTNATVKLFKNRLKKNILINWAALLEWGKSTVAAGVCSTQGK